MSNTNTVPADSEPTRTRSGDALGKTPKSHKFYTVTSNQVVIIGKDTTASDHTDNPDVWMLCDVESNATAPAANLVASIAATRKVNLPGKVVRVPITPATERFEYRDGNGKGLGFYLAVVYMRHRVRAVRMVEAEGGAPIKFVVQVADKDQSMQDLALEAMIENLVRRALTPMGEAAQLGNLRDQGLAVTEIARRIGAESGESVTNVTIHNKLSLLSLAASIATMVESGEIKVTAAYVIARAPLEHQTRLAADALAGQTVEQLKRTLRELSEAPAPAPKPATTPAPDSQPEAQSEEQDAQSESSGEEQGSEPPANTPAPTPTRTKRPKAADIAEMIERLAGDEPHMVAAREALRFVQGEQTDEQFISAIAALMGQPFPAKPAAEEKPEV